MAKIDECYNSLQVVQDNLRFLRKNYEDACKYQEVATYLLDDNTASLTIESIEKDVKEVMKSKGANAAIGILFLYPIIILIAIALGHKFGWNIRTFIFSFTLSSMVTGSMDVIALIKSWKKYKVIKRFKRYIDKQEELNGKTIKEIASLLCNKNIELLDSIQKREEAIEEYQIMLEEAKRNLANDILSSAGIDAQIEVNLSSNKGKNKELKKINVNK